MGNACGRDTVKSDRVIKIHRRDFQPSNIMKPDEVDRAVAKAETTTSYENISRVYSFKKELGNF